MATWKVGAARDLRIEARDSWDGAAASGRVFEWAGWPDNPNPGKARRAFLIYDADDDELKGSYKLPFADIVDGKLVAVDAGLRAAASYLPKTKAPKDVLDRARKVIDGYQAKAEAAGKSLNLGQSMEGADPAPVQDVKVGARNSTRDMARLQQIHDLAVENGAECDAMADGKSLTLDERRGAVMAAINKILFAGLGPDARPEAYVVDVFDAYAIVRSVGAPGLFLKVFYTLDEQGVVTVAPRGEWTPTTEEWKALTLNDRSWAVTTAINAMLNAGRLPDVPYEAMVYGVFDEFAVVISFATPGQFLRAPYTIDELGAVTVAPREEWTSTTREWRAFDDAMVAFGGEIKSLDESGRVGGYGVLFGDAEHKDLTGTWFAAETNYGPHDGDGAQTTMNHCLPLGPELKAFAERLLAPVKAKKDAIGIFVETVLDLADEYEKIVYELAKAGKFKWSSGTAQRLIRAEKSGKITNWPIIEWALTPIPAEPRLNAVTPLKSFMAQAAGTPGARPEADGQSAAGAVDTPGGARSEVVGTIGATGTTEVVTMDGATGTTGGATKVATTNANHGEDEMADTVDVKAIAKQAADEAVAAVMEKLKGTPAQDNAGFVTAAPAGDNKGALKSVNILRYGKLDEDQEAVMHEVYGGDYRELVDKQMRAFKTYVRRGDRGLDREADAVLKRQLWNAPDVVEMLKSGMTVAEIKATMVEGVDVLGGYALPPQTSSNVVQRLRGLTVMRGGGALVVQTTSNMIQWLKITGGGDQYVSGMRGAWGTEIQTPAAKNFTFGLLQIPVDVYTYKVPMSVSLVEDASNVVTILEQQIADTLAIDEDVAFLTGDGANKPRGILNGTANSDSITEAVSGVADNLSWSGLNTLRRAVASQYRVAGRASMIGNSNAGEKIENLVDGMSRPYIEELVSGETKIKSATWRESEALADVSAGSYSLIYGDLSGYAIVERLGLSIQRYNDSYTGINVIEFHVRRRIGGHVIEPWKLAVQKTAAS